MSESKAVTNWEEELAKYAKAEGESERPQLSRISLRGGVMKYMDQVIKGSLNVVVIANIVEHSYYKGRFDPNKPEAPDCFAFSETGEEMVPHEKSFAKQNDHCDGCPQFEWGSDTNSPSGKGKACKEKRKLLLLPATSIEDIKSAELAIMDLPVMSVKNWSVYVAGLTAGEGIPSFAAITEIWVDPDPTAQFKVRFKFAGRVSENYLGDIMAKIAASKSSLFVPYEKTSEGLAPRTEKIQTGKKY